MLRSPSVRGILAALGVFELLKTRRQSHLAPALERRRREIAAENYAARHLLEHTLDRKADLRRLAPTSAPAAKRYRELLGYELEALQEMTQAMRTTLGGRDFPEFIREVADEMDRLRVEIAWCNDVLARPASQPAGH